MGFLRWLPISLPASSPPEPWTGVSQLVPLRLFPPPRFSPRCPYPMLVPGLAYAALYPWNNFPLPTAINLTPLSSLSARRSWPCPTIPRWVSQSWHIPQLFSGSTKDCKLSVRIWCSCWELRSARVLPAPNPQRWTSVESFGRAEPQKKLLLTACAGAD